jgi:hypothetical protein
MKRTVAVAMTVLVQKYGLSMLGYGWPGPGWYGLGYGIGFGYGTTVAFGLRGRVAYNLFNVSDTNGMTQLWPSMLVISAEVDTSTATTLRATTKTPAQYNANSCPARTSSPLKYVTFGSHLSDGS